MARHIGHLTVEALREPGVEVALGFVERGIGDPNLLKPELRSPAFYPACERGVIDVILSRHQQRVHSPVIR